MGADFVIKEKIFLNLNAAPDPFPNPRHYCHPFTEPKPLTAKCLADAETFVDRSIYFFRELDHGIAVKQLLEKRVCQHIRFAR
jgi:hypothetical protein